MKHSTRLCSAIGAVLLVLASVPQLHAQQLAFTPHDSGIPGQADPQGGWGLHIPVLSTVFQVSTPVQVNGLAYYFIPTNTLDTSYTVSLSYWNGTSLSAPLATANIGSVSPSFASSINHDFGFAAVAPVTLTPGNTYVLSSTGADVGDFFYQTAGFSVASGFIFYEGLTGSNTPTGLTTGTTITFGPNLLFSAVPVPEPSTTGLAAGLLVLAGVFAAKHRGRAPRST